MSQHFGFVGVGRMGGHMAGRLLDAGHKLTIFDISEAAMAPLLARGAVRAGSPREVASAVETVFVSLPTPDIVHAVALGPDGLASGNRIKTYIDLSTTGPRMAAEVAAALGQREITTIDSPVSGGVGGAKAGTLAVMVASPAKDFARLEPVLKTFGRVFHVGERAGLGQTMKLANNMLSAAAMAISSEAIVMGVKAGLDAQTMVDVINAGSGRNTATQDKFPKAILPRSFNYGFAAGLMFKDVKLCVEEAAALKVPMVVGAAVHKLWQQANIENGPASDITEIVRLMEKPAGVEVKGRS
ncbi:MAG TPA: NAD(P)-dependent oxidoreductase [Alphaproteobacteria bacterium]|nr:NAD(P)-dependent oxidoreductase [Alphaproteobacteria bacterium]